MLAIAQAETAMPHGLDYRISIRPASAVGFDDDGFDGGGVVAGVVECHGWSPLGVGLPVAVCFECGFVADGDQSDDEERVHDWSPLRC